MFHTTCLRRYLIYLYPQQRHRPEKQYVLCIFLNKITNEVGNKIIVLQIQDIVDLEVLYFRSLIHTQVLKQYINKALAF